MESSSLLLKRTLRMNNGIDIPQVGFGCYQVRNSEPFYWALKHGYRHLDSAVFYGNEKQIGVEVRKAYVDFGLKREDLFITTKVPTSAQGYEKARDIIKKSLANFDLGYIDLVLIHHPSSSGLKRKDPKNREQRHGTWKALEEFVDEGLVRSIGVSNFQARHIEQLMEIARIKPVINQFELHPMYVEYETIEACRVHNFLVEAYSPFAQFHKQLVEDPTILHVAKKHGIDVAKTILSYLISKGFIVLPKSVHEERIASNIQLEGIVLTEEDINAIDALGKSNSLKVCWTSDDVE
jgi:diketogulonate reductase-like aldo/keto reductase